MKEPTSSKVSTKVTRQISYVNRSRNQYTNRIRDNEAGVAGRFYYKQSHILIRNNSLRRSEILLNITVKEIVGTPIGQITESTITTQRVLTGISTRYIMIKQFMLLEIPNRRFTVSHSHHAKLTSIPLILLLSVEKSLSRVTNLSHSSVLKEIGSIIFLAFQNGCD